MLGDPTLPLQSLLVGSSVFLGCWMGFAIFTFASGNLEACWTLFRFGKVVCELVRVVAFHGGLEGRVCRKPLLRFRGRAIISKPDLRSCISSHWSSMFWWIICRISPTLVARTRIVASWGTEKSLVCWVMSSVRTYFQCAGRFLCSTY